MFLTRNNNSIILICLHPSYDYKIIHQIWLFERVDLGLKHFFWWLCWFFFWTKLETQKLGSRLCGVHPRLKDWETYVFTRINTAIVGTPVTVMSDFLRGVHCGKMFFDMCDSGKRTVWFGKDAWPEECFSGIMECLMICFKNWLFVW